MRVDGIVSAIEHFKKQVGGLYQGRITEYCGVFKKGEHLYFVVQKEAPFINFGKEFFNKHIVGNSHSADLVLKAIPKHAILATVFPNGHIFAIDSKEVLDYVNRKKTIRVTKMDKDTTWSFPMDLMKKIYPIDPEKMKQSKLD